MNYFEKQAISVYTPTEYSLITSTDLSTSIPHEDPPYPSDKNFTFAGDEPSYRSTSNDISASEDGVISTLDNYGFGQVICKPHRSF